MARKKSGCRRKLGCLGCTGCMGMIGLSVLGVGAVLLTGFVVQSQWAEAVRLVIDRSTDGEVDFDELTLGLGTLTITGGRVMLGNERMVQVDDVVLHGWPWSWTQERVELSAVELNGVHVVLKRSGATWDLPLATQELLNGGATWPDIQIGQLTLTDVDVELEYPEGKVGVRVGALTSPEVRLNKAPVLRFDARTLELRGTEIWSRDGETLKVGSLTYETDPYTLADDFIPMRGLIADRVEGAIGEQGWTLPGAFRAALADSKGLNVPDLVLTDLTLKNVHLTAADGAPLDLTVQSVRSPNVTLEGLAGRVEVSPVDIGEWKVGALAHADWAKAEFAGEDDRLVWTSVSSAAITARLNRDAEQWGIPEGLWRYGQLAGGAPTAVERLDILGADVTLASAAGATQVVLERTGFRGVTLGGSIQSGEIERIVVREGDTRFATVNRTLLEENGVLRMSDLELWTTLTPEHHLELPVLVHPHVPEWAGGTLPTTGSGLWLGVEVEAFPWVTRQLVATDFVLHVHDPVLPKEPVTWDVEGQRAVVGPYAGSRLPVSLEARAADGAWVASGALRPSGDLNLSVTGKAADSARFVPYAATALDHAGFELNAGRADVNLDLALTGTGLSMKGKLLLLDSQLSGQSEAGQALAVASSGLSVLQVPVELGGDLRNPAYHPALQLVDATVSGAREALDNGGLAPVVVQRVPFDPTKKEPAPVAPDPEPASPSVKIGKQ